MIRQTQGIVLRSIRYGETSLISTIFTRELGVQSYLVQGVRSSRGRQQRAGLLQPATLLDLVVYQRPQKNLQRLKEFQAAHIYQSIQEEVVKNSVALFSVEVLLRLLPEHAPLEELFDFCFEYFRNLDVYPVASAGNFPIYFVIQTSRLLGYEPKGSHTSLTPHLNLQEGGFSEHPPLTGPFVSDADAALLDKLIRARDLSELPAIRMHGADRLQMLEWYIAFLQQHTQHLGQIRSLAVLHSILH